VRLSLSPFFVSQSERGSTNTGVNAIFGGFLGGLIIPREGGLAIAITEKLEDMVVFIFLPTYFTLSGLSTDLGTLNTGIAIRSRVSLFITIAYKPCLDRCCMGFPGSAHAIRLFRETLRRFYGCQDRWIQVERVGCDWSAYVL
jgi:hypothetical protein